MAVRDVIAVVLYAILTLVDSGINQDQIQADSFDVKPGAGRQEFVQQLVCHTLLTHTTVLSLSGLQNC